MWGFLWKLVSVNSALSFSAKRTIWVTLANPFAGGFTSDRLRDAANRPRPWAAEFVRAHAGKPAREVPGFVVDLGNRIGVLRPIAQQEICASCHGPADRISPSVRRLLDERYPRDRAVGFTNGEIRGWFGEADVRRRLKAAARAAIKAVQRTTSIELTPDVTLAIRKDALQAGG